MDGTARNNPGESVGLTGLAPTRHRSPLDGGSWTRPDRCVDDAVSVMLRASPPLTVDRASHYYKSEFSRGDYYTERESEGIVASRWHGRAAEQLGLSGRVKPAEFAHLLEGHDPSGSTSWCHTARARASVVPVGT